MDQPPVSETLPEPEARHLTSERTESSIVDSYVVVVRTREEFARWLLHPEPGAMLLQVEGLISDPQGWALAAQGTQPIPIDVILEDPAVEFSSLYRLVDVRNSRPVRVTIPTRPGFMKALRLAVSLSIPVRLLPGQPDAALLAELHAAAEFYLRDPMVEVPVEFFHSLLAVFFEAESGTLWDFLEQEPEPDSSGDDSVETHLARLIATGSECATCRWQPVCAGYFKHPDPTYDCAGVKQLFLALEAAADEIRHDLTGEEAFVSP